MNKEPNKEVISQKHLRIFFSNDGTWHEHIDYIGQDQILCVNLNSS